ncbi:hypothetical protein [Rhizobium indigoferae]|uniref:Helix-turn-helix domain-containing protein n=1 Tax=Rhizobium indigoferae TaxID=158891 RepID=A0ABZ0Z6M2_9HYPH|nr:hypothetical protein [Rhizobium indigoferae]NNU57220.1 hypothetical protein [Rhizobium indigoferae]WQN35146.1 hypothetical protein U5G49_000169 [Rhizobium indigoferae]GLR60282.1 hypothetical protein GCM10007919_50100 [Rhizobium indigoferae]
MSRSLNQYRSVGISKPGALEPPGFGDDNVSGRELNGFDPKLSRESGPEWSGKRRSIEPAGQVLLWRWPVDRKAQYRAFDDWHDIAMQIIHRAGANFRLMAVYKKVIRWKEGCIWTSDEELALAAGRCGLKTISREIGVHRDLGIISLEHGWRVVHGNRLRTRTIRLSVPAVLDPEVIVRDLHAHTVHSGPSEESAHPVSSGPNHMVHCGPITIDTTERGASRNVSA